MTRRPVRAAEGRSTSDEIDKIARAAQIASVGMRVAEENAVNGITEEELAERVRAELRRQGADGDSYLYVAAGERSGLAHGLATGQPLETGPVAVDIHTAYQGYHADMARTILLPGATAEQAAMYEYLKEKIGQAIATVRDGLPMAELRKRFMGAFRPKPGWIALTGPLLHGVGYMSAALPKFEYPHHNTGYPDTIQENMVLAMSNLGLCSPEGWGVRFEDTFVVTRGAPAILTRHP